jgi:alpha-galactosidase
MVNYARFPDFLAMTNYAHSLGLTAGWYGNNCICSDHCSTPECYQGDVDSTLDYGFDSIKLDGCGAQRDLTLYADLFNKTGKSILIENCHWGGTTPNATWCPWNYFRTSGDVEASYDSVVGNLQTTIQWAKAGLSKPGCWGYPDMMEVGVDHGPHGKGDPGLNIYETRAHLGAWCIVSSPLILSNDLLNNTMMDLVWPLISNKEVLAVNQQWAGFSGTVFLAATETLFLGPKAGAVPAWQFWYKPMPNNKIAVLLMNHASTQATLTLPFNSVPGMPAGTTNVALRDIWQQKDVGVKSTSASVTLESHDAAFWMLTPQ